MLKRKKVCKYFAQDNSTYIFQKSLQGFEQYLLCRTPENVYSRIYFLLSNPIFRFCPAALLIYIQKLLREDQWVVKQASCLQQS